MINPCQNGGICQKNGQQYICFCATPFTGKNCDRSKDMILIKNIIEYTFSDDQPCNSKPCQNGGTCTKTSSGYSCQCTAGFTGNNCDKTITPCNPDPCQNNGICQINGNTYKCFCQSPYTGPTCTNGKSKKQILLLN